MISNCPDGLSSVVRYSYFMILVILMWNHIGEDNGDVVEMCLHDKEGFRSVSVVQTVGDNCITPGSVHVQNVSYRPRG